MTAKLFAASGLLFVLAGISTHDGPLRAVLLFLGLAILCFCCLNADS